MTDYYHQRLKQTPDALTYLQRRGIGSAEAIERFKLGYADRTLGLRLPNKQRKAGAEIRERLEKLGLYRGTGHEHFSGCVVFPVIDPASGHVTEMYGRKIGPQARGLPVHLYLPGEHHGVWNESSLAASEEVILCESIIDALTFWCAGFRNVTCSYGVNGFTSDHLAAFKRCGTQRVLIAYDRDDAGETAAEKLHPQLERRRVGVLPRAVPKTDGCQRVRAEAHAGKQESGPGGAQGAVARSRRTATTIHVAGVAGCGCAGVVINAISIAGSRRSD